jgi:Tfp pilus assembly protein PilP
MLVALTAAATVVWAQAPAPQAPNPQPAAAQPAAPAPAAPGAAAPGAPQGAATPAGATPGTAPAPPPAEAYTYDPGGRRDPFVSLMSRGIEPVPGSRKATGLAGLMTNDLVVKGILQSRGSYVALVSGPDGKTFNAHVNDRLLDGIIRNVSPQGLVIMQEVNDPLSLVKQREVRKGLRAAEDGK